MKNSCSCSCSYLLVAKIEPGPTATEAPTPDSEAIKVRRDSIKSVIQEGGCYCVSIEHAEGGQAYVIVDKEDEWKVK